MSEEKKDMKTCRSKKKIMLAYGAIQLGSKIVSAIALAAIAFGFHSVKKEAKYFNECVEDMKATGSYTADSVRFCNGG